jgi:hypothetical protein
MVQIAVEVGAMGPQVHAAMVNLCKAGRADLLLDLVERAPSADAGAPVWNFLVDGKIYEVLLGAERVDLPLIARFVQRIGAAGAPLLLRACIGHEDAKTRAHFYEIIEPLGNDAGRAVIEVLPEATPAVQRELLVLLGRLSKLPEDFSALLYLEAPDPLVRREAVRLALREPAIRDHALMGALSDADDRVVFVGLTAAQEKAPPAALDLIRQRVDAGELDSQLRTMGIRIVAQKHDAATLDWLLGFVITEARWPRRPKLRPSTPEMLAALSALSAHWRGEESALEAIKLAEQSKDDAVRAKVDRNRASKPGNGAAA